MDGYTNPTDNGRHTNSGRNHHIQSDRDSTTELDTFTWTQRYSNNFTNSSTHQYLYGFANTTARQYSHQWFQPNTFT